MVGGAGTGEKLRKIKDGNREERHLNTVSTRWSFLLEHKVDRPSSRQAAEAEECLHLQRTVRQAKFSKDSGRRDSALLEL